MSVQVRPTPRLRPLDLVWMGVLFLYVLYGMPLTPFHEDEQHNLVASTDLLRILNGDWESLLYRADWSVEGQYYRLDNAPLPRYLMALAWLGRGYSAEELPGDFVTGESFEANLAAGNVAPPDLLYTVRVPSALMQAGGILAVFILGWHLGGRPTAWFASLYLAVQPDLLADGRRAMFEGPLFLFSLLVLLAALAVLYRPQPWRWLVVGVATGLLGAAKFTGVFVYAGVALTLLFYFPVAGWLTARDGVRRGLVRFAGSAAGVLVTSVVALVVFYALVPAWLSAPLDAPRDAIRIRQEQMGWAAGENALITPGDKLAAYPQHVFYPDASLVSYFHGSGFLSGIFLSSGVLLVVYALIGLGVVALFVRRANPPAQALVGVWTVVVHVGILATNTVPWGRYYHPILPAVALLGGLGLTFALDGAQRVSGWRRRRTTTRHAAPESEGVPA